MPHNNMQQDHAYGVETQFMRSNPTTSTGTVMMEHFHGQMPPIQLAPQDPPMIYRRHPSTGSAGPIYTVYVPAHQPLHNVHVTAGMPVHMVPASHYDDQSSYTRSHVHSSDEDTAMTTKHENRSATASFDSQNEVAHSVLLLANAVREQEKRKANDSPDMKVPFKKRKMVADILRPKEVASCRVSPVSHASKTSGFSAQSPDRSVASNGSSLEEMGGHPLPDSAKIAQASAFAARKTTTVPHFPSQLFDLLSSDESAVQWCSNGKAWRIVRWDALRKNVLPNHFNDTSVDAFLSEISAWGFTEITNGTDAGAYSHTLFRRGFPNLCKEILKFNKGSMHGGTSENSARHTPSILQVPSLCDATNTGSSEEESKSYSTPLGENNRQQTLNPNNGATNANITFGQPLYHTSQGHVFVPYQQHDDNHKLEFQQHVHPQATAWVSAVPQELSSAAYSPVHVRSGRGAARLPARLPVQVTPNPNWWASPVVEGRPNNNIRVVSNRGRRQSIGVGACVSMAPSYALSPTSLPTESSLLPSALNPTPRKGSPEQVKSSYIESVSSCTSPTQKPSTPLPLA